MTKKLIWIGLITGSIAGSFVPSLWGANGLSMWSIVTSGIGSLVGVWVGFKVSKM